MYVPLSFCQTALVENSTKALAVCSASLDLIFFGKVPNSIQIHISAVKEKKQFHRLTLECTASFKETYSATCAAGSLSFLPLVSGRARKWIDSQLNSTWTTSRVSGWSCCTHSSVLLCLHMKFMRPPLDHRRGGSMREARKWSSKVTLFGKRGKWWFPQSWEYS